MFVEYNTSVYYAFYICSRSFYRIVLKCALHVCTFHASLLQLVRWYWNRANPICILVHVIMAHLLMKRYKFDLKHHLHYIQFIYTPTSFGQCYIRTDDSLTSNSTIGEIILYHGQLIVLVFQLFFCTVCLCGILICYTIFLRIINRIRATDEASKWINDIYNIYSSISVRQHNMWQW
jgi:hypothetical protein